MPKHYIRISEVQEELLRAQCVTSLSSWFAVSCKTTLTAWRSQGRCLAWTASTRKTRKRKGHSRLLTLRLWMQKSLHSARLGREAGGASCSLGLSLLLFLPQAPVFLSSFLGVRKGGQWRCSLKLDRSSG